MPSANWATHVNACVIPRSRWQLGRLTGVTFLLAATTFARAADAPTGGPPGVRGFVLSTAYIGTPNETGICSTLTAGAPETFLRSLTPAEQAQYRGDDKYQMLWKLMESRLGFKWLYLMPRSGVEANKKAAAESDIRETIEVDPDPAAVHIEELREQAHIPKDKGAIVFNDHILAYDSCTNPEDFQMLSQGFQPYDGKVAFGMNLDNKTARDGFVNPAGESGVDNQLWRVLGCMKHFREFGNPATMNTTLFSAAAPTLIEISGIDDEHNDNDVTVSVYASTEPLSTDNRGRALAHASFDADPRPELIAHTHGRIIDGVVITEPADIRLRNKEQIISNIRELRAARIRATLKPDGSIEGGFYGYYTLASFYDSIKQMSQLGANFSSLSCPTIYTRLQEYADGFPDPQSHQNTAISSALNFVGVPAFVIRHADTPTTASAALP